MRSVPDIQASPTRREILLLLRTRGPTDVASLADELGLTGMAVRRHLDALVDAGIVASDAERRPVGRPRQLFRLTPAGQELFPRRYDTLALDVLEDVEAVAGRETLDAVLSRRHERLVEEYREAMPTELGQAVAVLSRLRDDAGYMCDWREDDENGGYWLVEANCAVHRVAEQHPKVCALELALFREALGDDVAVERVTHIASGDNTCTYRIKPRQG